MEVLVSMELNQTLLKIQSLLAERNWTIYKLSKESKIPYSSLNSLFLKNNQPTIATLEKICEGFHITMSDFFSDNTPFCYETYDISKEELDMIHQIRSLNKHDHKLLLDFLDILERNRS